MKSRGMDCKLNPTPSNHLIKRYFVCIAKFNLQDKKIKLKSHYIERFTSVAVRSFLTDAFDDRTYIVISTNAV
jgi:hypothetical protein